MEAPDKIYLFRNPIGVIIDSWYLGPCKQLENIEYTRTDALIEKAWNWIEDNILSSNQHDKSLLYYEQFKNYMKGE